MKPFLRRESNMVTAYHVPQSKKKHEKPAVDGEKLLSSHSIYFRDFPGLHLQVAFCLSVKTSLRAKLFI